MFLILLMNIFNIIDETFFSRHKEFCGKEEEKMPMKKRKLSDEGKSVTASKDEKSAISQALSEWVALNMRPMTIVNDSGFRTFLSTFMRIV